VPNYVLPAYNLDHLDKLSKIGVVVGGGLGVLAVGGLIALGAIAAPVTIMAGIGMLAAGGGVGGLLGGFGTFLGYNEVQGLDYLHEKNEADNRGLPLCK
jgi:hypothetical protein